MSKAGLIFPGQGAQSVGMGRDVYESSAAARSTFDRAADVLGLDVAGLCFHGPASSLEKTDIQQPAILITSVAIWAAYQDAGATVQDFACAAGLSLGEYTALHIAGSIGFDDAVRLVHLRGELMQAAADATPSGMVSIVGGDDSSVVRLCDAARESGVLAPANFNCPGQTVIAGDKAACERAVRLAEEYGVRAVPLAVAGAFHTSLMQSAADGLADALARTRITSPTIPVVSNVSADYHRNPDEIRKSLRLQLTSPVLWQRCVERMISDGADRFVEIGPGRVLTGLMRKINRSAKCTNINTAESIVESIGVGAKG